MQSSNSLFQIMTSQPNNKAIINQHYIDLLCQCQQAQKAKNKKIKKSKFSVEEDERLRELVNKLGENQWNLISNQMKNRNARQCRERWKNYLNPQLNNEEWSDKEDYLLLSKFNEFGPKWKKISILFQNRTTNSIRNRLIKIIKKANLDFNNARFDPKYFAFPQMQTLSMDNSKNEFYSNNNENSQYIFQPSNNSNQSSYSNKFDEIPHLTKQKNSVNDKIHKIDNHDEKNSASDFKKSTAYDLECSISSLEDANSKKCACTSLKSNNDTKSNCALFDLSGLTEEMESDVISGLFWDNNDDYGKNPDLNFDLL